MILWTEPTPGENHSLRGSRLPKDQPEARHCSSADETQLMAHFCAAGTAEAFHALYQASWEGLRSYIGQVCARSHLALDPADLLQDTFVNIYRYAGTFRPEQGAGFRGWARTIASNLIRRAGRRGRSVSLNLLLEQSGEPFDARPQPDLALADCEQSERLQTAYLLLLLAYAQAHAQLCVRDRVALEWIEVDGKSYSEAGRLLHVGPSNMKMIMFRARRRLREHMREALDGGKALRIRRAG